MGFSKFDVADYLDTPEGVEAYLSAVLEDGTAQEVGVAPDAVARSESATSCIAQSQQLAAMVDRKAEIVASTSDAKRPVA